MARPPNKKKARKADERQLRDTTPRPLPTSNTEAAPGPAPQGAVGSADGSGTPSPAQPDRTAPAETQWLKHPEVRAALVIGVFTVISTIVTVVGTRDAPHAEASPSTRTASEIEATARADVEFAFPPGFEDAGVTLDGQVPQRMSVNLTVRFRHVSKGPHRIEVVDANGFPLYQETVQVSRNSRRYSVNPDLASLATAPPVCAAENTAGVVARGRAYLAASNVADAASCLRWACRAGSGQACHQLSVVLDQHADVDRASGDETATSAERACALHVWEGCERAVQVAESTGRIHPRAREILAAACTHDVPSACFRLARFLRSGGQGVARNDREARSLMQRACDGGVEESCASLAYMLLRGVGGDADAPRALELWRGDCAERGVSSCFLLADTLYFGRAGVELDYATARWAKRRGCILRPTSPQCVRNANVSGDAEPGDPVETSSP